MRTRTWATAFALGAALLAGATVPAVAAPAAAASAGPVLIGYYDTSEECYAAGEQHVGEHACVLRGARWALYIYA
ncbi:hypothetical protein ACWEF9_36520 [Streptomyces sp. NPDC004980]